MLPFLTCKNISKSFGAQTLFSNISLNFHEGDRVGLIGPNGSGKSTLLKILSSITTPDDGEVYVKKHATLNYIEQQDSFNENATCFDTLFEAVKQLDIDQAEKFNRISTILSRAQFENHEITVSQLSGGWRKRLAICRGLVTHPDILILDEPTNHLDIEGILWLEDLIQAKLPESPSVLLMVSHDRTFLQNTVNRVVEISGAYLDGTLETKGNYSDFLEKKTDFLLQQHSLEEKLANKLRRETEWLQRGPKARTTKAKYRIDEAGRLKDTLSDVRQRNRANGAVNIEFDATRRKTKKLLSAIHLSKAYGKNPLFIDLDLILSPGSRLGLLGRNGTGKSTIMKLLADAEKPNGFRPDTGKINTAENVRIVSFDQRREQLDQSLTLRDSLSPDGDSIVYQGRAIHVVSWAKRFLFRPDQLDTPINRLSGGEQARILIAGLMRQPADILLLDEPTNDLDIPSLDVLEESLKSFPGALVLVTHDRYLLDQVCDKVLGFDGQGNCTYFADYEQWLGALPSREKNTPQKNKIPSESKKKKKKKKGKLSYLAQREYESMEQEITQRESRIEELELKMASSEAVSNPSLLQEYWDEKEQLTNEVESLYQRWEELEEMKSG